MKLFKRILIIKLSAIGDVIHALPVSHRLKECFPNAHVSWIVEKPAYDLLTNNPDINEIILFEKPKFKSISGLVNNLPEFVRFIREKQFDFVIDLQGLFKSAVIALITGADKRVGYCNMRELSWLVSKPVIGTNCHGHVVDRYLDVLGDIGCDYSKPQFIINTTEDEEQRAQLIAEKAGLNLERPYIVLAPGTNWPTKCWPAENYIELVRLLNGSGMSAVLIGGQGETKVNSFIAEGQISCVNLTGKTTLKELSHILRKAAAFVGGDTGPMHLASAVGTQTVALFGPTDPARNGPYGRRNIVLTSSIPCVKCWKRTCQEMNCMKDIHATCVYRELYNAL